MKIYAIWHKSRKKWNDTWEILKEASQDSVNYRDAIRSTSLMGNPERSFPNLTLFHSPLKCFSHTSNLSFSLNLLNLLIAALDHPLLFKIPFYSVFRSVFELLIAECDRKKPENLKNQKKG